MAVDALALRLRQARRRALWEHGPSTLAAEHQGAALERLLPHRAPFLLIDAVTHVDFERRVVRGTRRVAASDPVFAGHFPGAPVYPGMLQVEMVAQLCLCFVALAANRHSSGAPIVDATVRATAIHEARFVAEVHPGDQLTVFAEEIAADSLLRTFVGQVVRGETVCCVAGVEAYVPDG